jgi:hypothetical protein
VIDVGSTAYLCTNFQKHKTQVPISFSAFQKIRNKRVFYGSFTVKSRLPSSNLFDDVTVRRLLERRLTGSIAPRDKKRPNPFMPSAHMQPVGQVHPEP